MSTDFYIKRGDRKPAITARLRAADGTYVVLTNSTVKFQMRRFADGALVVSSAATLGNQTTEPGRTTYAWVAGDTDSIGFHFAEWEVTFTDGTRQTFPTGGYHLIDVVADLDAPTLSAAMFATVRRLRPMIAEPTMETYSDALLAAYLERNLSDVAVTAAQIWQEKAAAYAELVDVTEGSSSRKMSQLHTQALKQVSMYGGDLTGGSSSSGAASATTRAIERA